MDVDIPSLRETYIESCETHGVPPNSSIMSSLCKAEGRKDRRALCSLEIYLHFLKDVDFLPLLELCLQLDNSDIEVINVFSVSPCTLKGEYALKLMRAIERKLRVVDLQDTFGKSFSRDLAENGLPCEFMVYMASNFRKLNMAGPFTKICSLNLDFSLLLNSFHEECFTNMPSLKRLSMCETRVSNLWMASAALSKLPSLIELQFQNWLCCDSNEKPNAKTCIQGVSNIHEFLVRNMASLSELIEDNGVQSMSEDWETSSSSNQQVNDSHRQIILHPEAGLETIQNQNEKVGLCYYSIHSSPICFQRHYREYMIALLPRLQILDNLAIRKIDKDKASVTYSENFEHLPYRRKKKECVVGILQKREVNAGKSQVFHTKSISAAKVASSDCPILHPISISCTHLRDDERRSFRPRQFEYHPCDPSLMVFGTLDGEVVVLNHESETITAYIPSNGAMNSVLGLCWLRKHPSKLIAGSDNGCLKLYDIRHLPPTVTGRHSDIGSTTFDEFDQLTSVHVNSTDELFLASGYSKNVALYDISTGTRLHVFSDMHREHINVVKFANHSPSIFATSSFDRDIKMWDLRQSPERACYTATSSKGNVMVCFSPDDHCLLASAVDNEVRQLLAVDGRLHLNFDIPPTRSSQNYTRSYYMNGRDYIISGSCDEHVVRVCCAQTGRRLRDIALEGKGSGISMYVQSLRGDPFQDFNMSILAAYTRPSTKTEIVKVNMLAPSDDDKRDTNRHSQPNNSMGG